MAVFVDVQSCAYVLDTTAPVPINTINATTTAEYYVDTASGVD